MRRFISSFFILGLAAWFALAGAGCSREAKKARILARADRYYQAGKYDEAEIEYRNVLQLDSLDPTAISRVGVMYFEQGRVGRVFPFLNKARELQPNNLEARLKLGMFYLGVGKATEARDAALFVLDRRPEDEDAPILLAESTANPAEIEPARARLQKLPPAAAARAPAIVALGLLDFRQNKIKEAQAAFERARTVDPKSSAAYLALGTLYASQKDMVNAEAALAKAADLAPLRSTKRIRYVQFNLMAGHPDVAKRTLAEITQKTPDFLPAWLIIADLAATEKKYDESLAAIGKVLARDAVHLEAMVLSAQVRYAKGEKAKALAELERASSLYPQSVQVHEELGKLHLAMGEPEKAAASLTQALTLVPGIPSATVMLAQIDLQRGRPAPAVASLTKLIQQRPELIEPRVLLAQAYAVQGNLNASLEIYRQLEIAQPKNPRASLMIGLVLFQQKKKDEARQAFTKALTIDPEFLPAMEQLVNLDMADKQYAAARQRVEAQIVKSPKSPALQLLLAKIYLAEADTKQAEAALLKVVELQPNSSVGYMLLARLYVSSNQQEKALANLQQATVKNPKNLEALMLIAVLEEQQKNYAAARASYEKAIAVNPNFSAALNNLAYLYSERFNEPDKALQAAQKARELLPHEPHTADTLAWILYRKGQYPYALTLLAESAEQLPTSPDVQFHLGMTQYMMGEEKPARAALERALALGTDFVGVEEAKRSLAVLGIEAKTADAAARTMLEKAAADRPDPVALARLGAIHESKGDIDKASQAYEAALKASPNNVPAAMNMIRMYTARKEGAKALELAKATRKLAPDDADVAYTLARLAFVNGDYPWALSLLQESARKRSDEPEVMYDLAEAEYSLGHVAEAETAMKSALQSTAVFPRSSKARAWMEMLALSADPTKAAAAAGKIEQALQADPADVPALMAKGALLEQKHDVAEAKRVYEKTLARYPDFTPAKRRLTILYAQSPGDDKKAAEIAAKAREAYPEDAEVAKAFGIITFRQANYSRAVALLQESAGKRAQDGEVMYYLGKAQHQLKDPTAGNRSLQRALELGLSNDFAADAKKTMTPAKKG